jgi:gliding motility-associated-like protein
MQYLRHFISIFCCWIFVNMSIIGQSGNLSAPCARLLVGIAQDSVEWSAVPCANFTAYEVYGRDNTGGAFALLATITDAAQQSYVNTNTGEQFWQYQIRMICGGLPTATSIVVDNQRPITPNLRRVYISNNQPILEWDSSPSSDVIGYQIYKENPYNSGDFFPYPALNQLQTGNQFVDVGATDLLVRYAIVAVSPCNKSLLGEGGADSTTGPHTSIFMSANIDTCAQALNISWNEYENWAEGIENYEIWASKNQAPAQVIGSSQSPNFTYAPIEDGDQLDIFIRAVERNRGGNSATSNSISLQTRANRPMDFSYLSALTVDANNNINIDWIWDNDSDFASATILRDGVGIFAPSDGSQTQNNYTDATATPATQAHQYQIVSLDDCGFEVRSTKGKTIFLQAEPLTNFRNRVSWSPFELDSAQVQDYQVFRTLGGTTQRIATVSDTIYIDELNTSQENQYDACYHVVATAILRLPRQSARYANSRSNTDCALQNATLQMPNAFAPDGYNRLFRPVLVFGRSISNYSLQIFNRYGGLIFSSSDIFTGWDGKQNGEALPQGVYVYRLQYNQPDGATISQQGTVMLIR